MKTEPVALAAIARMLAAGGVALASKYGVTLDPLQVFGFILGAELAISAWVRSRVSPVKAAP